MTLEKLIMDVLERKAPEGSKNYMVCTIRNNKELMADFSCGKLVFSDTRGSLFTKEYAKWLISKLVEIRNMQGISESEIGFYMIAQ